MSVTIESLIEEFKSFNEDAADFGFIAMQAAKDSPVAIGSHAFYLLQLRHGVGRSPDRPGC